MSLGYLVVAVFLSGLAIYSIMDARAAWRDPHWRPVVLPGRGARCSVAARAVMVTSAAVLMATVTVASATHGQAAKTITLAGSVPAILGILAGGASALTLTFWRWPRFLVPPPQRAGPDGT
jgi:hypothetical protein